MTTSVINPVILVLFLVGVALAACGPIPPNEGGYNPEDNGSSYGRSY